MDEKDGRFAWFTKEDFIKHLESDDCLFAHQQGGKSIENDDYICTKVSELLAQDWVKDIRVGQLSFSVHYSATR